MGDTTHDMVNETSSADRDGGVATLERTEAAPSRVDRLPPWNVLLHDDDVNDQFEVVNTIVELTTLKRPDAFERMIEAHDRGISLLLATHREHAELLQEQFTSKLLTVTIEPGR